MAIYSESDSDFRPNIAAPGRFVETAAASTLAWTIVRVAAGIIPIPHAIPKLFLGFAPKLAAGVLGPLGFPEPLMVAYGLGVLELIFGTLLILGLGTRIAALAMVVQWTVITVFVAIPKGWSYGSPGGGAEFPWIMVVIFFAIVVAGAGPWSLDRKLGTDRWPLK